MKILPALFATILLVSISPVSFAQEAPEKNVKETAWATVTVPKTVAKGEKVTAEIKIKGSAVTEDCELWVNLSSFVGTTRKHNVARIQPIALKAGEDATHEASLSVPGDSAGVIFTIFTMPVGKKDWSDKLNSTEVAVKVQ